MTDAELRARILETGAKRVVIWQSGLVYAQGKMPNAEKFGWYLAGKRDELDREYTYERERNLT